MVVLLLVETTVTGGRLWVVERPGRGLPRVRGLGMMKGRRGRVRKLHVWGTAEILAWEGVRVLGGVAGGGASV